MLDAYINGILSVYANHTHIHAIYRKKIVNLLWKSFRKRNTILPFFKINYARPLYILHILTRYSFINGCQPIKAFFFMKRSVLVCK